MSIYHLVYATHLSFKKSDIFVATSPELHVVYPQWTTVVVIELLVWLLNCFVATEMIVVLNYTYKTKQKLNCCLTHWQTKTMAAELRFAS